VGRGAPGCGSRQSARRPSHAATHATGSAPSGGGRPRSRTGALPVCLRQWLRLRRQVLRLRLPRLYSGGGAETAWPPSGFFSSPPSPAARMW